MVYPTALLFGPYYCSKFSKKLEQVPAEHSIKNQVDKFERVSIETVKKHKAHQHIFYIMW